MPGHTLATTVERPYDEETTVVEAFDPDTIMGLADAPQLQGVARDANDRLTAALAAVTEEHR